MNKLTEFFIEDKITPIKYVETMKVKEGVNCDVYSIVGDKTKDFALVKVDKGCMTPLQRILKGEKTKEGFYSGKGILFIKDKSNNVNTIEFPNSDIKEVTVGVGDIMQWQATDDLIFYEICWPPYEDGRFENLTE